MVKRRCMVLPQRNECFLTVFLCVSALLQLVSEKDKRIDESSRQSESLKKGLIIKLHFYNIFSTSCSSLK